MVTLHMNCVVMDNLQVCCGFAIIRRLRNFRVLDIDILINFLFCYSLQLITVMSEGAGDSVRGKGKAFGDDDYVIRSFC